MSKSFYAKVSPYVSFTLGYIISSILYRKRIKQKQKQIMKAIAMETETHHKFQIALIHNNCVVNDITWDNEDLLPPSYELSNLVADFLEGYYNDDKQLLDDLISGKLIMARRKFPDPWTFKRLQIVKVNDKEVNNLIKIVSTI